MIINAPIHVLRVVVRPSVVGSDRNCSIALIVRDVREYQNNKQKELLCQSVIERPGDDNNHRLRSKLTELREGRTEGLYT